MDKLTIYKKFLLTVIREAGNAIVSDYHSLKKSQAKLKSVRDLVTAADLKSEKIIIDAIKKTFPDHQILSEEAGRINKKADYLWIIDPLDGTTNFFMHNPIWSVSIALTYKGRVILGAVYAPMQKELFHAVLGQGAYLNNRQIAVDNHPLKTINSFCSGRDKKNINKMVKYFSFQKLHSLDCRQLGSAALELAYVAAGRISSIMIPGSRSWDVAAGALLVKEAGGEVSDFHGRDWHLKERDILGADKNTHPKILKIIKSLKF